MVAPRGRMRNSVALHFTTLMSSAACSLKSAVIPSNSLFAVRIPGA